MSAPAEPLSLSAGERETLEKLARAQSAPHRQVLQARALLLAGDGVANTVIAEEVGVTVVTVRSWRQRFGQDGLAGLDKLGVRATRIASPGAKGVQLGRNDLADADAVNAARMLLAMHMPNEELGTRHRLTPGRDSAELRKIYEAAVGGLLRVALRAPWHCFREWKQTRSRKHTIDGSSSKPNSPMRSRQTSSAL